jgi:hypothetical protein
MPGGPSKPGCGHIGVVCATRKSDEAGPLVDVAHELFLRVLRRVAHATESRFVIEDDLSIVAPTPDAATEQPVDALGDSRLEVTDESWGAPDPYGQAT